MLTDVFVTKLKMTQAWTKQGKRVPVTICKTTANVVVGVQPTQNNGVEVAVGQKKLKNVNKPQRAVFEKLTMTQGATRIAGVSFDAGQEAPAKGQSISALEVVSVGDVVKVQGVTKGRGFAGGMKRYGFSGGPKTHGQSDRARAVGSIGAGTTPGRVFKGKKMPGHYGVDAQTVSGLVVLHVDPVTQEVWLSGPVPGASSSLLKVTITGEKSKVALDLAASGIKENIVPSTNEETPSNQEN